MNLTMFRNLLCFCCCFCSRPGRAQEQPLKNRSSIAPFVMQEIDGKIFKATALDKTRPVILICFSTDCDHCKKLTRDLLSNYKSIGHKQVVMITWASIADLTQFSRQFNLSAYHAIHAGTEGNAYLVPSWYNVSKLPFIALYKKGGALQESFQGEQPFNKILRAINKL